jgi:hypothetical protein
MRRISEAERTRLKASLLANIGDTIRGYDFKPMVGRGDCYVEGVVQDINETQGYAAFEILCDKVVFNGEVESKRESVLLGKTIYVPVQVSFMEYPGRVMNLSR